jgi:hypothetical protein
MSVTVSREIGKPRALPTVFKNKINRRKPVGLISAIKLKRTDTTFDLSQKAGEKLAREGTRE